MNASPTAGRRRLLMACLVAACCGRPLAARAQAQPEMPAEPEAQAAALQWLAETDAGRHDLAWGLAGAAFRGAVGREQWQGAARQVLGPLGAVQGRELNGSKATRSLPGVPDGDYRIFSFLTDFTHQAGAIETLTLVREADGVWRVVGYFVR